MQKQAVRRAANGVQHQQGHAAPLGHRAASHVAPQHRLGHAHTVSLYTYTACHLCLCTPPPIHMHVHTQMQTVKNYTHITLQSTTQIHHQPPANPACRSKMPWTTGQPTWVVVGPPGVTARRAGGTARTDTATSRSAAGLHGHATSQQSPTRSVTRGFCCSGLHGCSGAVRSLVVCLMGQGVGYTSSCVAGSSLLVTPSVVLLGLLRCQLPCAAKVGSRKPVVGVITCHCVCVQVMFSLAKDDLLELRDEIKGYHVSVDRQQHTGASWGGQHTQQSSAAIHICAAMACLQPVRLACGI